MRDSLGTLELSILLAVVRLGSHAHGVPIRDEIERRTGRSVSPGAIYTSLQRLEARGLVTSEFGEATPERGGKRKKHYAAQHAGVALVARTYREFLAMAEGIEPELEGR